MNKKRYSILIAFIAMIVLTSCSSSGKKGVISGKIDGAGGKVILLEGYVNNKNVILDSTVAGSDGSFSIVPTHPLETNFYSLIIDRADYITLITDSSECPTVSGKLDNLSESLRVDGSANSETLREFELKCDPFNKKEKETREKFMSSSTSAEEKAKLNQEIIEGRKEKSGYVRTWLDTHSSTPAALLAIQNLDPRTDMALINKVFTDLEKSFGHTMIYKGMRQQVQMMMAKDKGEGGQNSPGGSHISAGKPAPEIALPDPSGKIRKLSDLRGKTVLVDFWASWCGPCRRESPNVVKAYEKYNKDGFEVFSVSLDKTKQQWEQAIAADKLTWPNHVSDLKYWQSAAAQTYKVNSIPFTVLVDQDGNIIGHNLRGPMLEEKLKAIYGH